MENQNKYLILARRAREENNSEDARKYYDIVRTEDPDNAEAKFFYSYYRIMDGTKGEACSNFIAFCNGINSTISLTLASNDSNDEKKAFLKTVVDCLETAHDVTRSALRDIGGSPLGGQSVVAHSDARTTLCSTILENYGSDADMIITAYNIKKSMTGGIVEKYKLADEIESKYADIPEMLKMAIDLWKECIAIQQVQYNSPGAKQCQGYPEKYAEKIKKYEPAYVMPKKAGCISFGKPGAN